MAGARETVEGMPVGQRWGYTQGDRYLAITHPAEDRYILRAAWPVNAVMDEDPESFSCGCSLSGRSHAHAERTYSPAELDDMLAEFERCSAARTSPANLRAAATFAAAYRVGGQD